jgi:hypothetical protein
MSRGRSVQALEQALQLEEEASSPATPTML